ncbi:proteasome assembly chaperone 3 isoform X1 [Egretta garzetta]|uniref:proteasome assembly chaperone 3 isoform X1 n=1 Tax=Egretta garzetta TaxID=188379 RepID=UPI00163D0357|nr:proteasome assembly chaperone 3 isoform X1 [Egretta garzetta]
MEASPIVTSKQREEVVHGVPTEVVCTAFSNSVLVVVTQYGKMGTIVYVDPNTIGDNVGRPSLTTKVLLGKDESLSAEHTLLSNKFLKENSSWRLFQKSGYDGNRDILIHGISYNLIFGDVVWVGGLAEGKILCTNFPSFPNWCKAQFKCSSS